MADLKWWPQYYKKPVYRMKVLEEEYLPKEQKITFAPSACMAFKYNANNRGVIVTQDFIDGLESHTFHLPKNVGAVSLPSERVYLNNMVPINSKKIANIGQVQRSILEEYKVFYDQILK
ncbi:hypothetical protein NQ314_006697 [Rhamnusium bicolor]|uniref:Uncharacterized protein n=1 Tax=Rhamnusium bicolor TaxID=1586634 RepID=A0AAV8YYD3_9CUCU|nr:hypothetical protein NQ314_006697 [Rhamnusium bicolor]